jgi:putative sterol carrier protein
VSVDDLDPVALGTREFGKLVKKTPADQLKQLMVGDRRQPVLDELFRRMPDVFRADRAATLSAVVHWLVGDRPDGGVDTYELVIADGTCVLSEAPLRQPKLTLSIGGVDFLNLVTGNANPVAMVIRGKLRAKGDVTLIAKFPTLFDIPKS